jgi:hypothetical protein
LERLDRVGPRFHPQTGVHQLRARVRRQFRAGCLEGESQSVVDDLPEVDIGSIQRPLPAVFENVRAPRILRLRALTMKNFFDHCVD